MSGGRFQRLSLKFVAHLLIPLEPNYSSDHNNDEQKCDRCNDHPEQIGCRDDASKGVGWNNVQLSCLVDNMTSCACHHTNIPTSVFFIHLKFNMSLSTC